MRVLLDTHTFIEWPGADRRLGRRTRGVSADDENTVLGSTGSASQISAQARLSDLPGTAEMAAELPAILRQQGIQP